jgi:hypothetical protein
MCLFRNLALVALFRSGYIHEICNGPSMEDNKRALIHLFAHLFGRQHVPSAFLSEEYRDQVIKKSPSRVILQPMPERARRVLVDHDREILRVFTDYARTYASSHRDDLADVLPLSKTDLGAHADARNSASPFQRRLKETALTTTVRSPFVATSGHSDQFETVEELTDTARAGLHLYSHAIPSMGYLTGTRAGRGIDVAQPLNAYLLDFYMHGEFIQRRLNARS